MTHRDAIEADIQSGLNADVIMQNSRKAREGRPEAKAADAAQKAEAYGMVQGQDSAIAKIYRNARDFLQKLAGGSGTPKVK